MRKTVIASERMGGEYLRLEHESGLVILLYPIEGFQTAYALFGTRYGSIDNEFRTDADEDFIRVPDGAAHYLEHKLFESEDGNVDRLFAGTGAVSNAYTSFDKTCYLFSCTRQFEDSFRYLLRFVQEPYFTPETVAKEQGIIGQQQAVLDILLDVLAGPTSGFYEEMNRCGLLNDTFDAEVFGERGSLAAVFGGESRDPRAVCRAFCEMVERRKSEGLSEEEFLCCKNAMYGKSLKGLNDVENTANAMLSYEMMGVGLFDAADAIASVEFSELEECLHSCFDPACMALSIILPTEESEE